MVKDVNQYLRIKSESADRLNLVLILKPQLHVSTSENFNCFVFQVTISKIFTFESTA